jgi:hypothetical protein
VIFLMGAVEHGEGHDLPAADRFSTAGRCHAARVVALELRLGQLAGAASEDERLERQDAEQERSEGDRQRGASFINASVAFARAGMRQEAISSATSARESTDWRGRADELLQRLQVAAPPP